MTTPVDPDGYQRLTIKEGHAPYLIGVGVTLANAELDIADISTIKATIRNATLGTTVLDESSLTIADVWSDTLRTATDSNGDTVSYNLGWQTLASYFSTTDYGDDCQFEVEVWVTPVYGAPLSAWWLITARHSTVPVPVE